MHIAIVEIQNFRKLKACRVDIAKRNAIFVSASNSGKSSAFDAMTLFLKSSGEDLEENLPKTHECGRIYPRMNQINEAENAGMPCRVGITQHPSVRKQYWESQVVGLKNWRHEYVGSKSDAQEQENVKETHCVMFETNRGTCHAHQGGGEPNSSGWYVYDFDYIREQ